MHAYSCISYLFLFLAIPYQINEELEYRIGMMETSLSRFGMILDSIQSDIMQVNKGRKELALESKYFCGWIKTSNSICTITSQGQK